MSAKHQHPEYQRNAPVIRKRVRTLHNQGEPVPCGRCPRSILPGQPFDVGHRDEHGGHGFDNLRPEHRNCNRSHGGRLGASITNARHATTGRVTSWRL